MTNIINKLKTAYSSNLYKFNKMRDYYDGRHDIFNTYKSNDNQSSIKTVINYIHKFCEEEIGYAFASPVSFVSRSGDENAVNDIDYNLYHWQSTHNQELMRQLEIYGLCYELYYINANGEFCGRILNPTNAIAYVDADNIPQIFIHFYQKPFDNAKYHDIYYSDRIEIYKNDTLVETKKHIFGEVPVSVCHIGEEQTIYNKIKTLNDSLNQIISDNVNIIASYKAAYLVVTGADVDEETAIALKTKGILNLKSNDSKVEWLIKDVPDAYITNTIKKLEDSMYAECLHIDSNFQIQSNTSGAMLRNRILFLELRVKMVFDTVADTIADRIRFLFKYLSLKNINYDWRDISIIYSTSIPTDTYTIAQEIQLLGDKISLETALSRLPYVESPQIEIAKIKKERSELDEIDLDKIERV